MKFFILIMLLYTHVSHAEKVVMAFGAKIPPFVFPKTHKGIELDIIREALKFKGHTLEPKYFPLARVSVVFKNIDIMAVMTDSGKDLTKYGGHYANPAVTYSNVFITLKNKNIKIQSEKDLEFYSIIAFKGAAKRYTKWLKDISKTDRYVETNSQQTQVKLLISGRYDIVLSDSNIFKYFANQYNKKNKVGIKQEFREFEFTQINPKDYRPIFKSKKIRDDFNEGLKHLKETGRFKEIYKTYLK
jgi:polar amino acid transport system substrate-binding protein